MIAFAVAVRPNELTVYDQRDLILAIVSDAAMRVTAQPLTESERAVTLPFTLFESFA